MGAGSVQSGKAQAWRFERKTIRQLQAVAMVRHLVPATARALLG